MVKVVGEMKKRLQRKGARRGFTLVELLIVIIIIGILAGAMMMVAGGGRDAAEASKIVSDLRNIKAAAIMWMAENPAADIKTLWESLEEDPTPLNRYLDRPLVGTHHFIFEEEGKVIVKVIETPGDTTTEPPTPPTTTNITEDALLLGYDLSKATGADVRSGVKANLAKQAKSAGLYGTKEINMTVEDPGYYTDEDGVVYVIVQ